MPEKIGWTFNVQIAQGPNFTASKTLEVQAYDVVSVVVQAGKETDVEVQPAGNADQVQLLVITSDHYSGSEKSLRYWPEAASPPADADKVELDEPQLLIGKGAVGLLGASPQTLTFENSLDEDATVTILVGRSAISSNGS